MLAPVDFVIVAPLAEERDALLARLDHERVPPDDEDVLVYYGACLPVCFADGAEAAYSVVVTCLAGMGLTRAGIAVNDATRRWRPRYVLLVGIAGGFGDKAALGDVLIADQVADYEEQKITAAETRVRWSVHGVDPGLLMAAQSVREGEWRDGIREARPLAGAPALRFGVICTGNKSLARGSMLRDYQAVWDQLIGVEMEAGGAARAAFQSTAKPGFFMIRAVSDLADEAEVRPLPRRGEVPVQPGVRRATRAVTPGKHPLP